MTNVLVVGESWTSTATHVKGWDSFSSATFHSGRQRAGMPTMIKIRSLLPILVRHLPKFARYLFGSRYLGIPGANLRQFNQFVARHRHWAQLQYPMRGRSE